ncbi:unnamed protein product [Anisakis simplex]|uniref:Uncharacterized protein n=1 Tax=Anisakis simplex TaxID=6269 RepID=A0A3P6T1D7_ANISI|nr:unnamed protein product [Anisakis simplex]
MRRAKHKESFQATPPNDVKSSNSTRSSKDSSKQIVASPETTKLSSARPEVEKSSLKYCQIPSSSKQQQQEMSSSITDQHYYGNCSRASPQGFPDSRRKVIENELLSSLHQAHDFEPSSCQQQPEYSSQKDSSLVDPFASCSSQSESMLKSATSDDSCSIKAVASNPQKSQVFCDADLTMDSDLFDSPSQKFLFELASPIEPIKKALCSEGDEEVPLKERGKHFRRRTSTLLTADEYNGNVDNGIDHGNEEDDNNVNDKDKSVICAEMEVNSLKDSGDDSVWFDAKCYNNEPFTIATCSTQTEFIRNSPQISPQKSVETDVSPVKTPLASSLCSQRNANSNPPQISSAESSSLGCRVSNEIEVNDIWERRLTEASGATVRANHRLSKLADALKRRQQTLRSDLAMWRCDMINSPVLKGSAGSNDKGCFDCAIDKANDALGIDKNSGKGNDNGRDVNSEQKCAMQIQLDDASSSLKRWGVCWRRGNEVGTGRSVLIADSEPLNLIGNGNLNAVSGSDSCCSEHVDSYYLSLYKPLAKSELEQNSEKLMILLAPRFTEIQSPLVLIVHLMMPLMVWQILLIIAFFPEQFLMDFIDEFYRYDSAAGDQLLLFDDDITHQEQIHSHGDVPRSPRPLRDDNDIEFDNELQLSEG